MHTITVHIDESLSTREIVKLKHGIAAMPHVLYVEHPRHNAHNLTIDYEEHTNIPMEVLEKLHMAGMHADIVSG